MVDARIDLCAGVLTNALRRKVDGSAELVEVSDASKKKEEEAKKKEEKEELVYYHHGYGYYHPGGVYHHHPGYGPHGCPCGCNPSPDSTCSIM